MGSGVQRIATWLVNEKVIFTSMIGALRVEDFPEYDAIIIHMLETSPQSKIHILSDISMMTTMPSVIEMTKLKYVTHPKVDFFVTQSRNRVEHFIGQTVGKVLKTRYKFVHNLDDGIEFLAHIDSTLPSTTVMQEEMHRMRDTFIEQASEA